MRLESWYLPLFTVNIVNIVNVIVLIPPIQVVFHFTAYPVCVCDTNKVLES